jgi:hypothetical protein
VKEIVVTHLQLVIFIALLYCCIVSVEGTTYIYFLLLDAKETKTGVGGI